MDGVARPEAVARTADVPVGQSVAEPTDLVAGGGDVRVVQRIGDALHRVAQLRQDVAVQHVSGGRIVLRRLGGIEAQEGVRIPHGQHRLAHTLADALLGDDQVTAAQDRRAHQEPTHGVGAVAVEDLVDVRVVALGLTHLQAVIAQHDAVGHDLLESRAVEQRGGQNVHGVEPATGLAGVLHDEVRRGVSIEPLLVLERVVLLRKRHGARLEPAVQHLRHAAHGGLARRVVRVRAGELINVRTVQRSRLAAEVALQLLQGAVDIHARVLLGVGDPHRDRRAPVAVARDVPVARALQPLAELPVADVGGHPLDLLVIQLHHAVAELRHGHEPGRQSHVDQRLAGAPGVRVGVFNRLVAQHAASGLQILDDRLVCIEDQLTLVVGSQGGELAVHVHRDLQVDARCLAGEHIVLTESRSLVNHAGTVGGGDVVGAQHAEGTRLELAAYAALATLAGAGLLARTLREIPEQRLVGHSLQLRAGERSQNLGLLAELLGVCPAQVVGQHHGLAVHALRAVGTGGVIPNPHRGVNHLGVNGQSEVRRRGPRGGRPADKCGIGELRVLGQGLHRGRALGRTGDREGHRDGRVLAHLVGIIQAGFLVGQRRVLRPGVRENAEALVDQALVVEGLEGPHDGLHEAWVHRLVAVVEVHPARLAGDVFLPLVRVAQHGGGAVLVEGAHAHLFDAGAVLDAQLLLRLQLGGQAVAVPTEDAGDLLALHGLIARNNVLNVARQQVAIVRQAVGEGRAVVEDVFLVALAGANGFVEGAVLLPVLQNVLFECGEGGRAAIGHIDARVGAACWGCFAHGVVPASSLFLVTPTVSLSATFSLKKQGRIG